MTFLDRIMAGISRRFVSYWSDKLSWGGAFSAGMRGISGMPVDEHKAMGLTAYFAGINVISTDCASLPLRVYRQRKSGGQDQVSDDPRNELLTVSPDGETTSMRWRQAWQAHALGWGNGYAEIEFDRGAMAIGLHLLDPDKTHAERRPQDKRLFYRSGTDTIPPARVLHLAGLGFDGLSGYSPARIHREAIALGLATEAFGSAFFGNGTTTGGVLKSPKRLNEVAQDNLRKSIEKVHQGPQNAHKWLILEEGMDFAKTTVDPEDAQFLATRHFQVLEIARILRVPPHKVGDYSQSHLANIEAANIDYHQTTIMPWCRQIEQELNRKLFTPDERAHGLYVEHDMRAFLRGDSASRSSYYTQLYALGVLSTNDICDLENRNPVGPDGDRRFISANLIPLEQVDTAVDAAKEPAPALAKDTTDAA